MSALLMGFITASISVTACAAADEVKTPMKLSPFALNEVHLLEGPLKDAMEKNREYLHWLDNDRLLYAFRQTAGLPTPGEPLGGWEAPTCEVKGHFVGHYLTACAMMYLSAGDTELKQKSAELVAELAKCQQALGGEYLSAFPESFWDRYEAKQRVWAPYYTIHKILAGMLDQYELCGNAQALEVAKGIAAYFKNRTDKFSAEEFGKMMDANEEGGMCDALWRLFSFTNDPDHRALAEKFEEHSFLDPLSRGEDNLTRRHGNTHIPLAIGAATKYEITGEDRYRHIAAFFWDRVVTPRCFATGGTTDAEIWGEPFKLAHSLSRTNHETCKTHNMLKLTKELFCWTADPRYADYYERAFFNGIMGTQEPASGMLEYYVPQAPGHKRVFGTRDTAFWCCYGTGIESFSKPNDSIYFHSDDDLYVNLFIPSEVKWAAKGVVLTQTTTFPGEQGTTLKVDVEKPTQFKLNIHIPWWVARAPEAHLNGKKLSIDATPSSFWTIDRKWKKGDTLELTLPMALHTWPMPDDPDFVAIMFGPVVLAGLFDLGDSTDPILLGDAAPRQPQAEFAPKTYFIANDTSDLSWLKPIEGEPLGFRSVGQPFEITFRPFNKIVGERYGLYWTLVPAGSDRRKLLDNENKALAFLQKVTAMETGAPLDTLRQEFAALQDDPTLGSYRERLVFTMASALNKAGEREEAAKLISEYTQPFVARDLAQQVFGVIGAPASTDGHPLIVTGDNWDGSHRKTDREGRVCVATDVAAGKGHIYFVLPPGSAMRGTGLTAQITVDYYSEGVSGREFVIEYDADDSSGGAYVPTKNVRLSEKKGWHQATVDCPKSVFTGRQNAGADFRIRAIGPGDLCIAAVCVSMSPEAMAKTFAVFDTAEKAPGVLDRVLPGDETSEKAHDLQVDRSATGEHMGRKWRHAEGSWSWRMKVLPDEPVKLVCLYWGSDIGRTFEIQVDGQTIATQTLDNPKPGMFLSAEYEIPVKITKGKETVTVVFKNKAGFAGGVFGCLTQAVR